MSHFLRSFLALAAVTLGLTMSAQSSSDNAHFGIRVAYDYNSTTSEHNIVHGGSGASAGFAYYAPFGKLTYFNTGLMFFYDTLNYDGETGEDTSLAKIDGSLSMLGLKLPLHVGVKFYERETMRLSLYTGPQLYYNFSMRNKFDRKRAGGTEYIRHTINSQGMDVAWSIGAAADINRRWHVNVEYNIGLVDFVSVKTLELGMYGNLKRSEISVGVGYNF